MSDDKIVVVGGGGHASVVVDTLKACGLEPWGITDPDKTRVNDGTIHGVQYLGTDDKIHETDHVNDLVNGVASTNTLDLHRTLFTEFKDEGFEFRVLIHPDACVTASAEIGEGSQVFAGVVVQSGVTLAENVIVNTSASVDHDTTIGAHSHVAPGSTLCGNVRIGSSVHVGAGAVILQNCRIADGATVGAGAVVTDDVPPDSTVVGTPAEVIAS